MCLVQYLTLWLLMCHFVSYLLSRIGPSVGIDETANYYYVAYWFIYFGLFIYFWIKRKKFSVFCFCRQNAEENIDLTVMCTNEKVKNNNAKVMIYCILNVSISLTGCQRFVPELVHYDCVVRFMADCSSE